MWLLTGLHGCLLPSPPFLSLDLSCQPWGRAGSERAASECMFHVCCLKNPSASQWWAVMLTNCCSREKAPRCPRREHSGSWNLPWVCYFEDRGSRGRAPIFLTHLNKQLKRAKKESLSHYWRVTVGVVYGLWPTGCPTVLLPIGRRKHAVEKIKPEMFPSKLPKLGENLKSPLYGNINIMDKDSFLKNLFGRTGKMINWSKYKKQLNMTIHIVGIPLN